MHLIIAYRMVVQLLLNCRAYTAIRYRRVNISLSQITRRKLKSDNSLIFNLFPRCTYLVITNFAHSYLINNLNKSGPIALRLPQGRPSGARQPHGLDQFLKDINFLIFPDFLIFDFRFSNFPIFRFFMISIGFSHTLDDVYNIWLRSAKPGKS